jgi:diguanylate cyclase (GGDEF)-like protein/PAS domain S-box-containing protein
MTKTTLMVVEDEVLVAKDIGSRLKQMGYEVVGTAGRGADAITMARELVPNLILMDIHLRDDIDGIEAAEAIQKDNDIPIIFCTAYSNDETLERAKITAPYGYILKPFDNRELEINIEIALYKHHTERALHETEGRLDTTLRNISDAVIATDQDGKVFLVNPVAESLIKITNEDARGMSILQLLELHDFESRGQGVDLYSHTLGRGENLRSIRQHLVSRTGSEIPVEISANPISSEGDLGKPSGMVVSIRDISQQITYESQIRRNAFYDSLTNLPNRTLFLDRVGHAIYRAKQVGSYRFAVLFIDLDNFRTINEGLGHRAGDELIVEVSRRIGHVIGRVDTLSRFGGDIFGVLLENSRSLQEVMTVCDRIQQQFSTSYGINNRSIDMSCSIGIVLSHEQYNSPEDMIRDADTAMHRAKADGKGSHTVFDQEMYTKALRYIEWGDEMQKALEEQTFELHYQPIIAPTTGKLSSLEALIRWHSDVYGQVSPAEFIPVAEESGLILNIGEWILETVCRQIRQWKDEKGVYLKVGVNLSGLQFNQPDLAAKIQRLLEDYRIPPHLLGLEITEGVAMRDIEQSISTMEKLQQLGVSISIDDFGTGYSSLAYLKRFPISTLKIDRSFVTDITTNKNDQAIAHAVIALASALELDVLAEGVETVDQLNFLVDNGCDLIQGYYFSQPLKVDEVIPFLARQNNADSPKGGSQVTPIR